MPGASAPDSASTRRYGDVTEEKGEGATYTPLLLARFVAAKLVEAADLGQPGAALRVLDPAVGDGALLVSLLAALAGRGQLPIQVCGFDTDPRALITAQSRLASTFPGVELELRNEDFLDHALANANSKHAKFDLIIANPPYVRTQIMGSSRSQALAESFGLKGRVDLYHAFLIAISKAISADGAAGIIVSNRFMTTRGGARIREALRTELAIQHVWDLGDTKLFNAAVLPSVLIAKKTRLASPIHFSSIYQTNEQAAAAAPDPIQALAASGVVAVADGRRFAVQHGLLDTQGSLDGVWRMATRDTEAWFAAIEAHSWGTFRDVGKIRVGVKTCADAVFIRDDWDSLPAAQRPELLRPLTTHHIARRFRALSPTSTRRILYPHEVVHGQRRAVDLSHYPGSRAYLESHQRPLSARRYVMESGRKWYELWVPQNPDLWANPKLVFRDISESPTFWMDLDGTIVNGDCYWLVAEKDRQDLLWLSVAIANSKFIELFYDRKFNNKLYAGRRRFISQYVEQFPLPDPSAAISRQLIQLSKSLYAKAGTRDAAVALLEQELDQLVWRAFGLPGSP